MTIGETRDCENGQCIDCGETAEWEDGNVLSCPECGGEWTAHYKENDTLGEFVQFREEDGTAVAVVELERGSSE